MFKTGNKVKIAEPVGVKYKDHWTEGMREYVGHRGIITRARAANGSHMYEVSGCVSDKGVHYSFIDSDLMVAKRLGSD